MHKVLLVQACSGKSVVRRTDRPAMTIAVDLGHKATKQTKEFVCIPGFLQFFQDHEGCWLVTSQRYLGS